MKYNELFEKKDPGTYVGLHLSEETKANLKQYCKNKKIPHPIDEKDFHITIISSPKAFKFSDELEAPITIETDSYRWRVFAGEKNENVLVLSFESDVIEELYNETIVAGGESIFPKFIPHISLSYNIGDFNMNGLELPTFPLECTDMYVESRDVDKLKK